MVTRWIDVVLLIDILPNVYVVFVRLLCLSLPEKRNRLPASGALFVPAKLLRSTPNLNLFFAEP